jgi:hypothetical protein
VKYLVIFVIVTAWMHKLLNSVYHVVKFFIQLRYDISFMDFLFKYPSSELE